METIKNISLPVTGHDKASGIFKVRYQDKEYDIRQTGQEIPKEIACRVIIHDGEVEVTQEIENYIHSGALRRFTVKSDLRESAGVYELIDENGFAVYLYGAEDYRFFKGKSLLCNVISTDGARPYVVLNEKLENTGSAFSISKEYLLGLFPERDWDINGLVDLILYDGMEDPFDVKCYEWVISQSTIEQEEALTDFLFDVRGCCLDVLEKTDLLNRCTYDEVPILRDRITLVIEHMGYVKTAMETIAAEKESEYIKELFNKLRKSGYLYHPTKQFCVTTYLFKMKPDLMVSNMEEMMEVIRCRDISHWRREPFRTELIKQLENYIKILDHEVSKDPDKKEKYYSGFQALAIQLLLANNDEDLIDVELNKSMLYRYASHLQFANTRRMADASLNALLALFKKKMNYGLTDIGTPDKLYYHLDNWSRNQEIDRTKKAVYRSKHLSLVISDGSMCLMPEGTTETLKSALYDDVKLWRGIDVMLEKRLATPPYRQKGNDMMMLSKKLWANIEKGLYDTPRVSLKKEVKVKSVPEIGDTVLAYVYKQDDEDPNLFYCRIADEEKGFVGEGRISARSEEGLPGIVPYYPEPVVENFRTSDGTPLLMEMKVVEKTEEGICIMDMKSLVNEFIQDEMPNFIMNCVVGKLLSECTVLAVSRDGYPVFVSYDPMEADLKVGDHIEVMRKEKKWFMGGFIQGVYHKQSKDIFSISDAFANLIDRYALEEFEVQKEEERQSEIILEKSHVIELLNIIDEVASTETKNDICYNYLGFALMLSLMIGAEERVRYYRGQMEVAQMLHKFAVTNDVDDEELRRLQEVNKDLLSTNFNLRFQFNRLLAISYLGETNNDWLIRMSKEDPDSSQRKLASLVYSYNVLKDAGIDAAEVKIKIKELLNLEGRDAYFKTYTRSEGQDVEFKSSIVYPPNSMKEDLEKQTKNILKEVCAFLNRNGGTLYLGVNDAGGGEGLEEDMKHELFRDSRDKYDNYVRNQISLQLGQLANHCVNSYFDEEACGRDVYVLEIMPCEKPVKLDGKYYERQGSSSRQVGKDYLETFLKNRPAEYRELMRQRGIEVSDTPVALPAETEDVKETVAIVEKAVPKVRKIATSEIRNNVLHDYEPSYDYIEAYIHLLDKHKYKVDTEDTYEENDTMLTLGVHQKETAGHLILVYEDGKVCKTPMSQILDKDKKKTYNRFNGAAVVFACPATDDDVLFQIYEYKGMQYHRFQEISTIESSNIGDEGDFLFSVDFDKLIKSEIIGSAHKPNLPKMTSEKKKIGNNCTKAENSRSLKYLKDLGITF